MSPSDLKHIEPPDWVDPTRGEPTLMLFSVVDDRSGVTYLEYRCVYGEDSISAGCTVLPALPLLVLKPQDVFSYDKY